MPEYMLGANRIIPYELQVPPRPAGASHTTRIDPDCISITFSFRSAKKPTNRLSGDQKGKGYSPSVPARGLAVDSFSSLFQSLPPCSKTRVCPSGERAIRTGLVPKEPPVGELIDKRIAAAGLATR